MDTLRVSAGVGCYPRLGDRVYAAPHKFVADIPNLMNSGENLEGEVVLNLGAIDFATESHVTVLPEKLFGRHCAILGSTGGGKSWTTARIIEECIRFSSKIILLDATGEYRGFSSKEIDHYHLGSPTSKATNSIACSIPPSFFVESDFIAFFEPSGKVQGPKLREAIRSLKLAKLVPSIAPEGIILKANRFKLEIEQHTNNPLVSRKLDDPTQEFDVSRLSHQIQLECVYPDAEYGRNPRYWGNESPDISHCLSLLTRINAILSSPAFSCVFNSQDPSLSEAITSFICNEKRLLRVCLSGVSHEYKARGIIANAIGRNLLNAARRNTFSNNPLIVFIDEAHNFLGRHIGSEDTIAKLDSFEIIAKEGRKYGLNICLATQRPRDITEGVLSQMGTLIVHRLTNDRDREVVERACGEIDRSASAFLPNLKPGEAAIIGTDFPIPLTIQITPPAARPFSDGPDYQKYWGSKRVKSNEQSKRTPQSQPEPSQLINVPLASGQDDEEDDIPF